MRGVAPGVLRGSRGTIGGRIAVLATLGLAGCDAILGDLYNLDASAPPDEGACSGAACDGGRRPEAGNRPSGSGSGSTSGSGSGSGSHDGDSGTSTGSGSSGAPGSGPGITCNSGSCPVPAAECCEESGPSYSCVPSNAACMGFQHTCFGTADCPAGEICCVAAETFAGGVAKCETGPTCPAPGGTVFSAQLCLAEGDCGTDTCVSTRCEQMGIPMDLVLCSATVTGGAGLVCTPGPDAGL